MNAGFEKYLFSMQLVGLRSTSYTYWTWTSIDSCRLGSSIIKADAEAHIFYGDLGTDSVLH